MAKTIAWTDVPKWAQDTIREAAPGDVVDIDLAGETLYISAGVALYNKMQVLPDGNAVAEPIADEDKIELSALPQWAQKTVKGGNRGGTIVCKTGGNRLVLEGGKAYYNDKLVVDTSTTTSSGGGRWDWLWSLLGL